MTGMSRHQAVPVFANDGFEMGGAVPVWAAANGSVPTGHS